MSIEAYCNGTDPVYSARIRTAWMLHGRLINVSVPDGYCIVADGTDIIAARTDYTVIARFRDIMPDFDDRQKDTEMLWDEGLITLWDYFCRRDQDYAVRWPAIAKALDAICADQKSGR